MNIYRLIADMSHLFAILFLLFKIGKTRSCAGISGKSQVLFLVVFVARYLDLFTNFVSYYNSFMKILFIACCALTVGLIFVVYKSTYDSEHDTFRVIFLLCPAATLAFYVNHEFSFLEIMWTFSIYLEAVAILPQFQMIRKTGNMEMFTYHYLFALGLYRAFYIFNWVYRYRNEMHFDAIAFWSGCVQTVTYCYLLYSKEFLKGQAHAYFRLYNREITVEAIEKGDKSMMTQATGGGPENPSPSVQQPGGVTVPNREDGSANTMTQQLDPTGSVIAMAPPAEGSSPERSDSLSAAASVGDGQVPFAGETEMNSSTELLLSQPQGHPSF